jgi:xanthine dehydrogenase accessory factor
MRAEFIGVMETESAREIVHPVYADYVLDSLMAWRREGLSTALVTLVGIDGSSPRPLGSQIAVASDGRAVGAVTGGCAEQAIVLDALTAMANGRNHLELYGNGSRFKDITLPCGSGVYLYFDVTLADRRLHELVEAHQSRRITRYVCEGPQGVFEHIYRPQNRLLIIGSGHIVPALAQLSRLSEYDTIIVSPDDWTRRACAGFGQVLPLISADDLDGDIIDAFSAVVSLFHDHDLEPDILSRALASKAMYIGALGSRRTHLRRIEQLTGNGWPIDALDRIHGPVGVDIGAQTPPEIAMAIMAEIIGVARKVKP